MGYIIFFCQLKLYCISSNLEKRVKLKNVKILATVFHLIFLVYLCSDSEILHSPSFFFLISTSSHLSRFPDITINTKYQSCELKWVTVTDTAFRQQQATTCVGSQCLKNLSWLSLENSVITTLTALILYFKIQIEM